MLGRAAVIFDVLLLHGCTNKQRLNAFGTLSKPAQDSHAIADMNVT